ncbi:hypothetical protein B0O95_10373 [Mycetohabitans endofungorum]|uniref:Uncharacterized protein n=1 Tax=Mycetohabitans endofungorum TaxID=417203 RepID=A0A2P5KCE3_9BURK|nr:MULTISPECIES: hypothetical protein [Mycetohabitans]PPB84384.1 hypothetical protein B0O95_10373 [Mycetohabitans endofungorum]
MIMTIEVHQGVNWRWAEPQIDYFADDGTMRAMPSSVRDAAIECGQCVVEHRRASVHRAPARVRKTFGRGRLCAGLLAQRFAAVAAMRVFSQT